MWVHFVRAGPFMVHWIGSEMETIQGSIREQTLDPVRTGSRQFGAVPDRSARFGRSNRSTSVRPVWTGPEEFGQSRSRSAPFRSVELRTDPSRVQKWVRFGALNGSFPEPETDQFRTREVLVNVAHCTPEGMP